MNAPAARGPGTPLERLLSGRWLASGLLETPGGRVRLRFDLTSEALALAGGVRVLEHYRFDDGRALERAWSFVARAPGHWQATADDVAGQAIGTQEGAVSHLRYRLLLPWRGHTWRVLAHDRLHPLPDGALLLRSTLRKWGLRAAELTAVYRTGTDPDRPPGGQG